MEFVHRCDCDCVLDLIFFFFLYIFPVFLYRLICSARPFPSTIREREEKGVEEGQRGERNIVSPSRAEDTMGDARGKAHGRAWAGMSPPAGLTAFLLIAATLVQLTQGMFFRVLRLFLPCSPRALFGLGFLWERPAGWLRRRRTKALPSGKCLRGLYCISVYFDFVNI